MQMTSKPGPKLRNEEAEGGDIRGGRSPQPEGHVPAGNRH